MMVMFVSKNRLIYLEKKKLQLRIFFLLSLDLIPRSFIKSSSVIWDKHAPSMVANSKELYIKIVFSNFI